MRNADSGELTVVTAAGSQAGRIDLQALPLITAVGTLMIPLDQLVEWRGLAGDGTLAVKRFIVILCLTVLATGADAASSQQLIPATSMGGSDSQGFLWDVQQDGSINDGTSDCFDGGMHLVINGQHFQSRATDDDARWF